MIQPVLPDVVRGRAGLPAGRRNSPPTRARRPGDPRRQRRRELHRLRSSARVRVREHRAIQATSCVSRLGRYLPPAVEGNAVSARRLQPRSRRKFRRPCQHPRPGGRPPASRLRSIEPVDTLPVVTDFRWNPVASGSPVLRRAAVVARHQLFGWLAWPLLFPLTRGLADRGHGLARAFGWLLVGWVHWMGVSLGLWQNPLGSPAADPARSRRPGRIGWARAAARDGGVLARAEAPDPGAGSAFRRRIPAFRRHPPAQPRLVAAVERRREVHGVRLPERHPAQPGLSAL